MRTTREPNLQLRSAHHQPGPESPGRGRRRRPAPLAAEGRWACALTHRVQAVELYLKRHTFTQIRQRIRHSLSSIANYVVTFAVVVAHTRDGHSVDEIAFLMQISPSLVRAYQELYKQYDIPEYREWMDKIIARVKTRGFRPTQLENEPIASAAEKRGLAR